MANTVLHMRKREIASELGITLMEVLVAMSLIGIMSMAAVSNLTVALKTAKYTEINFAANSLAISKVEELAAFDAVDLSSANNSVETAVTWEGLEILFTRTTSVTVNADDSRTVSVTVASNNANTPTSVNFSTTFALWE